MLRSVSAGLMCVGLATLGVAVSRGQETPKPAVEAVEVTIGGDEAAGAVVVEGDVSFTETTPAAQAKPENGIQTIEVRGEGLPTGEPKRFRVQAQRQDQDLVITTDDGKVVETRKLPAENYRQAVTARAARIALPTPDGIDAETRAALEQLKATLRDESERLGNEGKPEEAAQKARSANALDRLLAGNPAGQVRRLVKLTVSGAEYEELKKLQGRRDELAKRLAATTDSNDSTDNAIAALKHELAALDHAIVGQKRQIELRATAGGASVGIMHPGAMPPVAMPPGMPGGVGAGGPAGAGMRPGFAYEVRSIEVRTRSQALTHQADALSQASAKLKEAGLHEQAKQLADQAEKLKAQADELAKREAERIYAQPQGGFPAGGFGGGGAAFYTVPPVELHRGIKELHEQVQLLRKEVAEIREMLQQAKH